MDQGTGNSGYGHGGPHMMMFGLWSGCGDALTETASLETHSCRRGTGDGDQIAAAARSLEYTVTI